MSSAITLTAVGIGSLALGGFEASQATGNASFSQGLASSIYGGQQGYQAQLANLINNPGAFFSSPVYQAAFGQGEAAVARETGAQGFLGSGNQAGSLQAFGQTFGEGQLLSQEQLFASLSGLQTSSSPTQAAGTAIAGQGQSFNELSAILASQGLPGNIFGVPGAGAGIQPGGAGVDITSPGGYVSTF